MIESLQNPQVKQVVALHQRKGRDEAGLILIEGIHALQEALKAGLSVDQGFCLPGFNPHDHQLDAISFEEVSDRVMAKMATTQTPPACLAMVKRPFHRLESLFSVTTTPLLLVLDGLQDPGNLGTLCRTAVAFGVTGMLCLPGTVDVYSPKVIRSAAGVLFQLAIVDVEHSLEKTLPMLQEQGCQVYLTTGHRTVAKPYREVFYRERCALVLGNEGQGLSIEPQKIESATWITIPMASGVESLNVGVSGALILAEAAHQRTQG